MASGVLVMEFTQIVRFVETFFRLRRSRASAIRYSCSEYAEEATPGCVEMQVRLANLVQRLQLLM